MSLSSKTKVTAVPSKKPRLFTFSQLIRIYGRNDKFCYSDNSRCMPYRRPVNENIEKICSKRMFTCLYVMEPNRYHVLKRNQYLAGSRALPAMKTQVMILKFHTALLPNSWFQRTRVRRILLNVSHLIYNEHREKPKLSKKICLP